MKIFLKVILFCLSGVSALIYMLLNAIGNSQPDNPEQYCNIKINDWGYYEGLPNAMEVCFEELVRQHPGLYFILYSSYLALGLFVIFLIFGSMINIKSNGPNEVIYEES